MGRKAYRGLLGRTIKVADRRFDEVTLTTDTGVGPSLDTDTNIITEFCGFFALTRDD